MEPQEPPSPTDVPRGILVRLDIREAGGRLSSVQRARDAAAALVRSRTFVVGLAIVLFWIIDAIFWRAIVPHNQQVVDAFHTLEPPSHSHWFGTDDLGRDVFSRVLAGASPVLIVAPASTALGLSGGIVLGVVSGYYRGVLDGILMRIVDALLAFPLIIIAVLALAVLGGSLGNTILVIAVYFAPTVARTVRSAVLVEREQDYVATARLRGESDLRIMFSEILPNILGPITVEGTIRLGYAIFTSATLSFLSLGIQQPSPDWGLSIALGRQFLQVAPWVVLFPAGALASLVIGVSLIADGVKQVFEE